MCTLPQKGWCNQLTFIKGELVKIVFVYSQTKIDIHKVFLVLGVFDIVTCHYTGILCHLFSIASLFNLGIFEAKKQWVKTLYKKRKRSVRPL